MESPDLYRFIGDVERVAGIDIAWLDQGKDCWDVWMDELMFTNPQSGGCLASYHLKKLPLAACAASVGTPEETTIHVGFGPDEDDRIERLVRNGAPWRFDFPLLWTPRIWRCDLDDFLLARGIAPSKVYDDGYQHDNCNRRCILGGIKQRMMLLKDDPLLYAEDERKEQEFLLRLRAKGRKEITILKDRRGGVTRNLSLKQLREEVEAGVREFDDSWRAAPCSCIGDLIPTEDHP